MSVDYARIHPSLRFDRPGPHVLRVTLDAPGLNAVSMDAHHDLAEVWTTIDKDPDVHVAVIQGAGRGFSAGGSFELLEALTTDYAVRTRVMREARDLVWNVVNCSKPIVSALHGPAVGAGLVAGLLADVSVAARTARIIDGHTRLGVAAGDHAAVCWPLLCGMAKAKYYLMTAEFIDGKEAERIGLVSLCTPAEQTLPKAMEIADKLAAGSQMAIRFTKKSLNGWMKLASPIFDNSLAMEMLCFLGEDAPHGVAAVKEKRAPKFPSAS